jgi:hypothetical protein
MDAAGPLSAATATVGSTTSPPTAPAAVGDAPADGFCDAVAALNEFPESENLTSDERERALTVVNDLLRLWPAASKDSAETYFGEIQRAVQAGSAVDLDNSSEAFRRAFGDVFEYAADACPGGFG